ncbi:MAG TPA: trypsin-like peptidase domain-containing protein [Acidimicrobiales bacterium]|nr:trypsin-like peptidase domain-containing protein [Acidimicrobiales bacterium]
MAATVSEQLSGAMAEVTAAVAPSVVGVGAGGSGVVVGSGRVLTNAHNLRGSDVVVTFPDGRRAEGSAAGVDADGDLAVVAVDTGAAPALALAGGSPRMGEAVLALANPGGRGVRVSAGIVSALDVAFRGPGGRRLRGAIEHSAPLARGSSGGPLVDLEGRVLGIDTHRAGEGFYLAVAAGAELAARVEALAEGQAPRRPRLGVALAPPNVARRLRRSVGLPALDGLLVHAVEDGGPAGRSGIEQGDLIVAVAGTPVTTVDELADALERAGAGAEVAVAVVRGAEQRTVEVRLDA